MESICFNCESREFAHRIEECARNREDVTLWGVDYVALPVDADGVPIHVGDYVEETDTRLIGRAHGEVIRIVFNKHTTDVRIDTGLSYADRSPQSVRHITKKPTVEDVLREFADEWLGGGCDDDGIVAEYAARLRLAGDE